MTPLYIDTHAHLYVEEFDSDRVPVIERACAKGVTRMLQPAIDSHTHEELLKLCDAHPDRCIPMMGVHPTSIGVDYRRELEQVEQLLQNRKFVALGEIGLDFHWSTEFASEQQEALRAQLDWARKFRLPVALHARKALPELSTVLRDYKDLSLVMHAYSGSVETARELLKSHDVYFGIGGVLTFKNSRLKEVVQALPLDRIVLETDCPYLTPEPHRGQRNEPSYIPLIAAEVAGIKNVTVEQAAAETTRNAENLFSLEKWTY